MPSLPLPLPYPPPYPPHTHTNPHTNPLKHWRYCAPHSKGRPTWQRHQAQQSPKARGGHAVVAHSGGGMRAIHAPGLVDGHPLPAHQVHLPQHARHRREQGMRRQPCVQCQAKRCGTSLALTRRAIRQACARAHNGSQRMTGRCTASSAKQGF